MDLRLLHPHCSPGACHFVEPLSKPAFFTSREKIHFHFFYFHFDPPFLPLSVKNTVSIETVTGRLNHIGDLASVLLQKFLDSCILSFHAI